MAKPVVIKKYGNRRLYDTDGSRYITLEQLADKVRSGSDVQVVDVKSGTDLTQATLTQILVEGRGAAHLVPVGSLTRLIRMEDEHLADFLGQCMTSALELYLRDPGARADLAEAISPGGAGAGARRGRDRASRGRGGSPRPRSPGFPTRR